MNSRCSRSFPSYLQDLYNRPKSCTIPSPVNACRLAPIKQTLLTLYAIPRCEDSERRSHPTPSAMLLVTQYAPSHRALVKELQCFVSSPSRHKLPIDFLHPRHLGHAGLDPGTQIPALADVEPFQFRTSVHNAFDAVPGHSHAPPDAERTQLQQMQADGAE